MFPKTQLKWILLLLGLFLWSSESLKCIIGFLLRNNNCVDSDECATPNRCGDHALCFNTPGSYHCTCDEGFQSSTPNFTATTGRCRDINECFEKTHECPGDMVCVNTVGSYSCTCQNGYRPSRTDSGCEDIDECSDPDVCGSNADCYNHPGGYSCKCLQGYTNYGNVQLKCIEMVHFCLANE